MKKFRNINCVHHFFFHSQSKIKSQCHETGSKLGPFQLKKDDISKDSWITFLSPLIFQSASKRSSTVWNGSLLKIEMLASRLKTRLLYLIASLSNWTTGQCYKSSSSKFIFISSTISLYVSNKTVFLSCFLYFFAHYKKVNQLFVSKNRFSIF